MIVAVTDHAVERFRQRVSGGEGRSTSARRSSPASQRAWQAGRWTEEPPEGVERQRGSVYVSDLRRRDLVYVCRWDRPKDELLVVTLWEAGESAAVPREFTDELRRMDRRLRRGKPAD